MARGTCRKSGAGYGTQGTLVVAADPLDARVRDGADGGARRRRPFRAVWPARGGPRRAGARRPAGESTPGRRDRSGRDRTGRPGRDGALAALAAFDDAAARPSRTRAERAAQLRDRRGRPALQPVLLRRVRVDRLDAPEWHGTQVRAVDGGRLSRSDLLAARRTERRRCDELRVAGVRAHRGVRLVGLGTAALL